MPAKDKRSNDGHSSLGVPNGGPQPEPKKKVSFFSFFRNNNDGSCGRHWRGILRTVISPTKRIRIRKKREKKNVVLIGGRWGKRTTTFFMSFQIVSLRNLHITIIQFITLGPKKKFAATLWYSNAEKIPHKITRTNHSTFTQQLHRNAQWWCKCDERRVPHMTVGCWTVGVYVPKRRGRFQRQRVARQTLGIVSAIFFCVVSYDIRIRERR